MPESSIYNTKARYGSVAQILHWITAGLILFLLPLGIFMHELPYSTSEEIAYKAWFYSLHKTLGMTVLTVAIIRIIWALVSTKPAPMYPERKLETFAAETIHWILYVSILLVPLTGYIHHAASSGFAMIWGPFPDSVAFIPKSEDLSKFSGVMHWILAMMMAGSIALHIAGALKHVVIDRDGTLARMIPFLRYMPDQVLTKHGSHALPIMVAILAFVGAFGLGTILYSSGEQDESASQIATTESSIADPVQPTEELGGNYWIVDHENSTLEITVTQLNSPVAGKFAKWEASIQFNPADLGKANVSVTIDMNSLTLGGVTKDAKGGDFLDVTNHPTAVFTATDFSKTETGYLAKGELELHGVKTPVELPFTLEIVGSEARMSGSTTLNRLDFGIGAKGFADEKSVNFAVEVSVNIKAEAGE